MAARLGRKGFTLVEIMIVVLIIGILLAIAIPNFIKARETARLKSCVANLKQIEGAKEQYAMDQKLQGTDNVTFPDDLVGASSYIKSTPECPSGGTYATATVDDTPTCDVAGHALP
jgi:prepilin-type N-terminal cleavage/methylation domain-containing protein